MSSTAKKVPAPESAIKRAVFKIKQSEQFAKAITARKAQRKALEKKALERGVKYARQYSAEERKLIHQRRVAKAQGGYFIEPRPKVIIVTRIRGIAHVAPKQRKVLQLLRLRQIFNTVFVKNNKPMQALLRLVEPLIAYGYPTVATVRKLLYKRGHLRLRGQRVKIANNEMIAQKFKNEHVVCFEDMVNQIVTAGPHFRSVTNALWPFKLAPPRGGMRQKRRHFVEGGDFGNRETLINGFIGRMA